MAGVVLAAGSPSAAETPAGAGEKHVYQLLATSKTSTMQKELDQAAAAGFRFEGVMGGETGFGGKEVVVILSRPLSSSAAGPAYEYKLLATSKTSTMQKELDEAAAAGFRYRGQTVTETLFGGPETVIILERQRGESSPRFQYRLLATSKTSTMQKELTEAGQAGFTFMAVTVGKTAFGGREVVCVTERPVGP
jgi:hypothetical protein